MNAPFHENAAEFATEEGGAGSGRPPLLLQYWLIVVRRRWLVLGIMVAAMVAAVVVTLLVTPQYTAQARLEISREQQRITNVEGLQPESAGRDLEFYQTQYSLLESETLAQRVARELNLSQSAEFREAHKLETDSLLDTGRVQQAGLPTSQDQERVIVEALLRHVDIKPIRGSALVDVAYTSGSPVLSAQIANAWTKQFIAASSDRRMASTVDARSFLEGRLADLRARLERSERDLVNYTTGKGIVTLGTTESTEGRRLATRTLVGENLETLSSALNEATADRIKAQSELAALQGGGINQASLANDAINSLRSRRAEVAAEYSRLLVQFEPEYPAARAVKDQLDTLDRSIAAEESRVVSNVRAKYREAADREGQLRATVDGLKGRLAQQDRDSIQMNIYQREADTNRQLYDALLQRYKEIGVAGVGASNVTIVDPATPPKRPSEPSMLVNLVLGLALGALAAGIAVIIVEQIDEGFREPGDIATQLGIPLLGAVLEEDHNVELAEMLDPKTNLSESYLAIRTSLGFVTDHGVPRSIMTTSTREAEGKTTTNAAMAIALARQGRKVILIDADMRSPSIHEVFGIPAGPGLSNYLSGDEHLDTLIHETTQPYLAVMQAGPVPPSAAELLSTDRMERLIKLLGERFDHVVIDSPPVLGLADAPLLARMVEGCILVVESRGVSVRRVMGALERLQTARANILGGVLTKLRHDSSAYGYGYGYGYGYDYGADGKRSNADEA